MSSDSAQRGRWSRARHLSGPSDGVLAADFAPDGVLDLEPDSEPDGDTRLTPRLGRGLCWRDVVAEMERDRLLSEEAGEAEAA